MKKKWIVLAMASAFAVGLEANAATVLTEADTVGNGTEIGLDGDNLEQMVP